MPTAVRERSDLLSVSEAAGRLGVSARTLRYYEELGFVTPARTAGGHRLYGPAELAVVERIGRMQAMGFALGTIRKALRYRSYQDESGQPRLATDDLRRLADEARADADAVRDRIAALRRELDEATHEAAQLEHDAAWLERRLTDRLAEEADGARR